MAAAYTILGKSVPAHYLSLATLGAVTLAVVPKPWAPGPPAHPAINAANADEEKFVRDFLAKHEKH